MYKAFIVDDDYGSVESIYNSINWNRLNITKVELIQNPTHIVERIISEKPEVVFIDIEMGDVSGLEIIKQLQEKKCGSIFVIVSGHDDFAYAKQAIEYGVIYYLLKPISNSEADNVTEKIFDALCVEQTEGMCSTDDICLYLADKLREAFPDVSVAMSAWHMDCAKFF